MQNQSQNPLPSLQPLSILILGGGISGLTTALSLTKFTPPTHPPPSIKIFEIRPFPATIGGAVNLTPNALRLLSYLGALHEIERLGYGAPCEAIEVFDLYTGGKIAESSFKGKEGRGLGDPPFRALRIGRGEALKGVLAAIDKYPNIEIECGKRTVGIVEDGEGVKLTFQDGDTATGDILVGCDGIHSVTRLLHVEPERKGVYSGICNAFGFAPHIGKFQPVHFTTSAMNFSRRGMLLTSFHSPEKDSIYVGGLMEVPEIADRDGWKAAGKDEEKIRAEMLERFGKDAALDLIPQLIHDAKELFLWPVFTLPKSGKWYTSRVILIGDSAHAMPPQGESTGIVFEDGVLFSRCIARWMEKGGEKGGMPVREAFEAYEKLRRGRIDAAFEESQSVVKTVRDAGWLGHIVKMRIVPWYLWWTRAEREGHFVEDVTRKELNY
ncbi:FAD/NAD(P)-binding domain-containing protein [Delitschia confertaspora ATCC 74209]|uniref:FAD/NAD(P)-binding domain-containing protein n=1 Tax=Delitschia confertaspora ATCC 74209 TaxID=1513339 RepID=A0A9P4JPC5_9PLEO|nr:FAD/NAD(P)-binding domain-containing protein [Delitschia confertaspora ATCC 74209]